MMLSSRSIRSMRRFIHSSNISLPIPSIIRLLSCHQVVMLELLQRLGIAVYDFPSHAFLQIRQSVPALASHHHVGNSLVLSHPLQCPRADFQQVRRLLARQQDFRFLLRHVVFLENIVRYAVYLLHHRLHDLIVHRCLSSPSSSSRPHCPSLLFPYPSVLVTLQRCATPHRHNP